MTKSRRRRPSKYVLGEAARFDPNPVSRETAPRQLLLRVNGIEAAEVTAIVEHTFDLCAQLNDALCDVDHTLVVDAQGLMDAARLMAVEAATLRAIIMEVIRRNQ